MCFNAKNKSRENKVSSSYPKEYILEPSPDEIRPYRILLEKVN